MIQHESVLHYQALQGKLSLILALAKRVATATECTLKCLLQIDVDIYVDIKLLIFTVGPLQKPRPPQQAPLPGSNPE